jgi:hypothetical protein
MEKIDRAAILEAVHQLPADEQVAIAEEILRTARVRPLPPMPGASRDAILSLRGIAKTADPLDDEQLIDQARTERYG